MADYYQTVDQIRALLQATDQTRNAGFDALASAYNEACTEINQRMGRCHRLLQQGLRSEAIQLADAEPKLLDAMAALDFPERAAWDYLSQIYELPPAPKLAVDQARFLNEAYAEENPLQELLRTHRRLALQRTSTRSRIATMRKLAAQDSNNPIWNDDLRAFEKVRFREVQLEASQAAKSHDLSRLKQLLEEIEQQSWVESPPKVLMQGLRKAEAQLKGQQTKVALGELDARLNEAFAQRDAIRGRIVRQEWTALTAQAQPEPGDPIWGRVGSALRWLEDQDRLAEEAHGHEEALAKLVEALDGPGLVHSSEFERLARAVLQYNRGVPESIQQRYVACLRSAQERQTRRLRLMIAGAVAGLLVASSLGFYTIRNWTRGRDATQAADAVLAFLNRGEVEQAGSYFDKVRKADPGLLTYPPMLEAQERLQILRDKENERILEFDRLARTAELAPGSEVNTRDLESARMLVRHETEAQFIENLVKRRTANLEIERQKHETDVAPRMTSLDQTITGIQQAVEAESFEKTEDPDILGSIADAQRKLNELRPAMPYVGSRLQSSARVLGQRLDSIRSRLEHRRKQIRLEEEITGAVAFSAAGRTKKMLKFVDGLDAYIKSLPEDPRAKSFKQTRDEQTLWYTVEEWNKILAGWKPQAGGLTPQAAKSRAAQCASMLAQYPAFPGAAEVARFKRYAEAVARRAPSDDSPTTKVRHLLSDILVGRVWMLTVKTDAGSSDKTITKRFYSAEKPEETNGGYLKFSSIISFEGKQLSRIINKDAVTYMGLSPQSQIAARFKPLLTDEKKLTQWNALMTDLVDALLHQPDIDPILQVALLRNVIDAAIEGSEPLRLPMQAIKNRLDEAAFDVGVPWMNPDAPLLSQSRAEAAQLIQTLPRFAKLEKQAAAQSDQIERDAARQYKPVGWLARGADGWKLRSGPELPRQGDLWIIANLEDKRGEWRKVGKISDGKSKLDAIEGSSLSEGRPVFVIVDSF